MNGQLAKSFALGATIAMAVVASIVFAQPIFVRQRSSLNCPMIVAFPTSFNGSGFLMSERTAGPNNMQFVVRPNSTAFLEIDYFVGSFTAQSIYANRSQYFLPVQSWGKLGSTSASPVSATEVGLSALPVNVNVTGNNTLTATYEVTASASAVDGAYVGSFWSTCGPQVVLTVGNSFYTGPGLTNEVYY